MIVQKDLKYFWFLYNKWINRSRFMSMGVSGEYVYILSAYLENMHISFPRIRRIRGYPVHLLGEYAEILSEY